MEARPFYSLVVISSSLWCGSRALAAPATERVDCARDIQPSFASRCYECHGDVKQKSGRRLDDKAVALRGGESGKPALVPGSSASSRVIQLVTHPNPDERMPRKGGPLSRQQVALQTFDVPNADFACVRRRRRNSPLQALVSLNEPVFVAAAQSRARATLAEGGKSDSDRLTHAFRRVLARPPVEAERRELLTLLAKQTQRPAAATPTQLAACIVVARVLRNLDETITKE